MKYLIFPESFNLKFFFFLLFIWGLLNGVNGFIIFFHDIDTLYLSGSTYYFVIGGVRILISVVSIYMAFYGMMWADKIIIHFWNGVKKELDE
jgi:hypothetical protein